MRRLLTVLSLLGLALSSALSGLLIARPNLVRAYSSPGKPKGYVSDYSATLSAEAVADLNRELDEFASQSSNQIFIVLINSLDGDSIDNYANELFREWQIGTKEKNNGVLFLAAINDRQMRIEVGYGLEGAITDLETSRMQEGLVRPAFKEGDYEDGIRSLVAALKTAAVSEYNAPYTTAKKSGWSFDYLFWGFFVFSWFASFLARSKSWWAGGVVGLIIAALCWIFADSMALKIAVSALAPPIGLLLDYIVSKNYKKNVSSGGHGGFFGTFGGFSSGGGGGGFSGGFGGSSGGGGSSSSW